MSSFDNTDQKNAKISQSNWYAKLHPIGTDQQVEVPKRPLNLSIFFRIWLAVALVLIICGIVVFTQLFSYVKPTVKQVIEDTLLDTSKLMAASLQEPLQSGTLYDESYQSSLDKAFVGQLAGDNSKTTYDKKTYSSFRIYVTDNKGIVIYDSLPESDNAEGEDYSRWNDIYLTLRGQYGVRSTVSDSRKRDSSIMYVAQPIVNDMSQIIGVVSVGKPVASVLPYLDNTRERMLVTALLVSIIALMLAGLVAWWLKQSITLVTKYTRTLAEDTQKPYFYLGNELNNLTDTIETMKHRLENKAYVSDYVHTLTHELKSPLTAIRASGELLEDDGLDAEDRQMLIQTVGEQSIKMQLLIDRLLLLAKVEQPTFRLNRQSIPLVPLLQSLIRDNTVQLQQQQLAPIHLYMSDKLLDSDVIATTDVLTQTTVFADRFWLVQSLQNLLDNAIHFAESRVNIVLSVATQSIATLPTKPQVVTITIFNDGKPIPDYALTKAFDRYFSLSHQRIIPPSSYQTSSGAERNNDKSTVNTFSSAPKKGTGLGLTLVKQVVEHHGGSVSLNNIITESNEQLISGVKVSITLPLV
ncbi:two-component system sensor histidine kinase CreC [Psychrobacter sp. DM4]|uniref:two-component system sensor histidine kinase CreC n=1 Tax=Psychrobacter sp. DM4 TaxID=3440637 RepID=UPI003F4FE98A